MPSNVGTFFGFIDECQYLSGIVAGHMTKSKKIGFVAAKPVRASLVERQRLYPRRPKRES